MVKVLFNKHFFLNTSVSTMHFFCTQFSEHPKNNTRIVETNVNVFDQLITQWRSLDGVPHGQTLPEFSKEHSTLHNTWRSFR